MEFITLDFETYYDKNFSLTKLTTEEYIRDDRFEIIGVGVKVGDGATNFYSAPLDTLRQVLTEKYDWANAICIAHNAQFDAAILTWKLGIKPKHWVDTLALARAIDGLEVSGSLKAAAERHGLGEKGTEVINAIGKRRVDFSRDELHRYGTYCINDVDLTWKLYWVYEPSVTSTELEVINITTKMFSEPVLELNLPLLELHLEDVRERKEQLLNGLGFDRKRLSSNPQFADVLRELGVTPPTKVSVLTGEPTYAFSKTDEGFTALLEHSDFRVQAVAAARLGVKSTLEETRTERFISVAKRGSLPVPLRYYAAHTGRWGGSDKINLQNLPSRGTNANALKMAIVAPPGYVIIDSDSSQIEARVLGWLAGQEDLVEVFEKNNAEILAGVPKEEMVHDPYKIMASKIYQTAPENISSSQRFMGKTVVLGCGYGMGAVKFKAQVAQSNVFLSELEASAIINTYRDTYPNIPALWRQGQACLEAMVNNQIADIGVQPRALTLTSRGFLLPSGLYLNYAGLDKGPNGEFSYLTKSGRKKIYGGKVIENLCQAIARCIIAEQMAWISRKYKVVLTVHDAIACVVKESEAQEAADYVESCMRRPPVWAEGLPLNCEYGIGKSYGDC
jgi:DNA polymerase